MNKLQVAWTAIFTAVLVWSGIGPHDYPTWLLEVTPAIIAAAVLWYTRERFPLTRLVYVLILLHCIILMIGGHYTYAEVPAGDWVRELLDGTRNNYDKLGHFAQYYYRTPDLDVPDLLTVLVVLVIAAMARQIAEQGALVVLPDRNDRIRHGATDQ